MKLFEAEVTYGRRIGDQIEMGGYTCQVYADSEQEARDLISAEESGSTVNSIKEIEEP